MRAYARPGLGSILAYIRSESGITRADLARATGLGRAAISQRVDQLIERGLVRETSDLPSTGGRPPSGLVFDGTSGVVLAADLGATHARLAAVDLAGAVLAEVSQDLEIARGPDLVLDVVATRFHELLDRAGRSPEDLQGIGLGVPGPVEFSTGRPISPPIMPGWDGFAIPERLADYFEAPILVDNDVNVMAAGEHWATRRAERQLLFVKVGTGVGCGIVVEGRIYRGAEGAAGDIGHIKVAGHDDVRCECGNIGCLEAVAGGRALVRQAQALGLSVRDSRDVVALALQHDVRVLGLIRNTGRTLGEVLAGLVNAFNPHVIVLGGDVAEAQEQLLAGIKEVVYQSATPLATSRLEISQSRLGDRAGIVGAAVLAIEHVLSPAYVDGI